MSATVHPVATLLRSELYKKLRIHLTLANAPFQSIRNKSVIVINVTQCGQTTLNTSRPCVHRPPLNDTSGKAGERISALCDPRA